MEGECATTIVRGKTYARATTVGKLQRWHRCESWWRTASAAAAAGCNSCSNLLLPYPIHRHSLLPLPPRLLLLLPLLLPHEQAPQPSPCFSNPNSSSSSLGPPSLPPCLASLAASLSPSLPPLPKFPGNCFWLSTSPPPPKKT